MKKITAENTKILVCCHKKTDLPEDKIFLPVQVGSAISDKDLGFQKDDELEGKSCENISEKNKSYCELTALFWAWKNLKKLYPDVKYVGLNHYRRYFSFNQKKSFIDAIQKKEKYVTDYKINYKKLNKIMSKKDMIVAKRKTYKYSLFLDYCECHISDDIRTLQKIIHEKCPEYDQAFYSVICRNNKLSHYNMFITDYENFNKYCDWLFSILAECENRINIENYNPVQKRIFGYMAERLFNVWINKNNLKVKRLNVYMFTDKINRNSFIKRMLSNLKKNISAFAIRPVRRHPVFED